METNKCNDSYIGMYNKNLERKISSFALFVVTTSLAQGFAMLWLHPYHRRYDGK